LLTGRDFPRVSAMITLYFVRHGETDWNRQGKFQGIQDIPLNEEGRRQARTLAGAWGWPADTLVSSPLGRARETAQILGATLGLPVEGLFDLLVERDYGQASGLTLEERRLRFPEGPIPGSETPEAIQARATRFLDMVVDSYPGRSVVAVSHGGFINVVLALVSQGRVGTGKSFLGNASVTTLVHQDGRWDVVLGASLSLQE